MHAGARPGPPRATSHCAGGFPTSSLAVAVYGASAGALSTRTGRTRESSVAFSGVSGDTREPSHVPSALIRRSLIRRDEYDPVLTSWNAYRFPRFVFISPARFA